MALSTDDEAVLAFFEVAPCGLVQTTDDGIILRANRTFCAWLGVAATDLIDKRRFQDLLTVGGRIFHHTHWAPLLRMQGSISEVKLELVISGGATIPIVVNAARREDRGAVVHDIAAYVARDRDRYEQELVRSRKQLEQLVEEATRLHAEAKDRALFAEQMMGIVSHDLRNPLGAIQMGAELLRSGSLSDSQRNVVDRIFRAGDRATQLIADLLDFTQARLGPGLAIERAPTDLHDIVAETLDELRLAHPNRITVHVRDGGSTCSADAARLHQVVSNLVSNALTYGDRTSPVTVRSAQRDGRCSIAVNNVGPVISPEVQATIFEPMKRASSANARARSVGLGLFIVREIARAHGGTASVASSDADGTTFTVEWPA